MALQVYSDDLICKLLEVLANISVYSNDYDYAVDVDYHIDMDFVEDCFKAYWSITDGEFKKLFPKGIEGFKADTKLVNTYIIVSTTERDDYDEYVDSLDTMYAVVCSRIEIGMFIEYVTVRIDYQLSSEGVQKVYLVKLMVN